MLIPKGKDKPLLQASSYRTICLLSSLGKLYETMLKNRLEKDIENKGGFSANQFGFRKGKSTIQEIEKVVKSAMESNKKWVMVVTVDIKNAFNMASWEKIMDKLEEKGIARYLINVIDSYLSHRYIRVENEYIELSTGVPQGSVLGPTLWNVLYDGILRIQLMEGVTTVAFADDLAVITEAADREELVYKTNESLYRIERWIEANKLQLAPQKSEVIILKGPSKREEIKVRISGTEIDHTRQVKYLGVTLDDRMGFGKHIKDIVKKAESKLTALSKLMPNVGGPGSKKRIALYGVVQSVLLYAAPVWKDVIEKAKYRNMLIAVQRRALIRVVSGYRTISAVATQVIAGIPPINLLVEERFRLHLRDDSKNKRAREEERAKTLEIWQEQWRQQVGKGDWTKLIIKDVKKWVKCEHRKTNYYLTQFLSGHGNFAKYLQRMNIRPSGECRHCRENETPEHVVFRCPRWENKRRALIIDIDQEISQETIIETMIRSPRLWNAIQEYIIEVMATKEMEDREIQPNNIQ